MPRPLYRLAFDNRALLASHPPRFDHPHKAAMFELAYPDSRPDAGELSVSRWPAGDSAEIDFRSSLAIGLRPDFYDYAPAGHPDRDIEWHVNFADPDLFVAYGSPLLAQDEMQVVEHPLLGSVREALIARGLPARTVDAGRPTPVLVQHVERRIRLDTLPNAGAGRPRGLYGSMFATTPIDAVRRAATRVEPLSHSNIIAMAAPVGGPGRYRASEIDSIMVTAWTAFDAARLESDASAVGARDVVVHSGWWGCGVFGGNRVLMAAMQVLAARAAGLSRLVLHVGYDPLDEFRAQDGVDLAGILVSRCNGRCTRDELVREVMGLGFKWGTGDGH